MLLGMLLLAALPGLGGCARKEERGKRSSPQVGLRKIWTSSELPGEPAFGSFSPEGERVAVVVIADKGRAGDSVRHQLWLVGDGYAKPLSGGPSDVCPDWSPKNDEVVYLELIGFKEPKNAEEAMNLRDPGLRVVVVDAGKGEQRVLKTPPGYYGPPRWSPDGRAIALDAALTGGGTSSQPDGILVINPRQNSSFFIGTPGGEWADRCPPSWSSDGNKILSLREGEDEYSTRYCLWLADTNTRKSEFAAWIPSQATAAGAVLGASGDSYYYLALEWARPPGSEPESAVVLRYDVRNKNWGELVRLSGERGWLIGAPQVNADVTGVAAETRKIPPAASGPVRDTRILWWYHGQRGRLQLPSGTAGGVLAWSRDGRRIAVSEMTGGKGRVVVYEFQKE